MDGFTSSKNGAGEHHKTYNRWTDKPTILAEFYSLPDEKEDIGTSRCFGG